ncbi:MAG: hypothetical protein JXR77_17275 [Lentisphaeria bacterium]|nr:hypothetical protein [Lentisphaeria bacterium]
MGDPFRAGVHFRLPGGWHLYWSNPGEAGLAPRIEWQCEGVLRVSELLWPAPVRFAEGPIIGYGYADEVLLASVFEVPPGTTAPSLTLHARVTWLACADACVPGEADLSLTLPVEPLGTATPSSEAAWFERFARRLPVPASGWEFRGVRRAGSVDVWVTPPRAMGWPAGGASFFPLPQGWVSGEVTIVRRLEDWLARFSLSGPSGSLGDAEPIPGIWVLPKDGGSPDSPAAVLRVAVPTEAGTDRLHEPDATQTGPEQDGGTDAPAEPVPQTPNQTQ